MIPATDPKLHLIAVPIRTSRGGNNREHHFARHKRVKQERFSTAMCLRSHEAKHGRPSLPCVVLLTRCGPNTTPLDDDNLEHALKAVRDEVASWLGTDDGGDLITWVYAQRRNDEWGVMVAAQEDDDDESSDETQAQELREPGLLHVQGQGVADGPQPVADAVHRVLPGPAVGDENADGADPSETVPDPSGVGAGSGPTRVQ